MLPVSICPVVRLRPLLPTVVTPTPAPANRLNDTLRMAELAAQSLGIAADQVAVASTGVIGVFMCMDKIEAGIREAAATLSADGGQNMACAIMTTDLVRKEAAVVIEIAGKKVTIGATAKGSGMIHPNMATMLAFITTDAAVSSECLQTMLKASVNESYNMISVDRDTSTNDMTIILANGMAGNPVIENSNSPGYEEFQQALNYINKPWQK